MLELDLSNRRGLWEGRRRQRQRGWDVMDKERENMFYCSYLREKVKRREV
ncbi:uncharacterized protein J3R85_014576 [Psidium guajava]|nr:uncharacterized protein J3R85_014576 [Psidium guajava]